MSNKFKFHKIGNDVASGWYALIDSSEALLAHLDYMGQRVVKNWKFIKDSPDNKEGHCKTQEAANLKTLLTLEMQRLDLEQMGMPECINYLSDITTRAVREIFKENGKVYTSKNGSCRPDTKLLDCEKILEEAESKDYVFPVRSKKDLKIHKWPGGKHYYIFEDGVSITIGNQIKWNTAQYAQDALDRYWGSVKIKNFTQMWNEKAYK